MDRTSALILGGVAAACVVGLIVFPVGPAAPWPPPHLRETLVGLAFCLVLYVIRQFWLWFFKIDERLRAEQEIARNTRPAPTEAGPPAAP